MEQQILESIYRDGFCVARKLLDVSWIDTINSQTDKLVPQRAHDLDHKYWTKDKIHLAPSLGVWWSQQIVEWDGVQQLNARLTETVGKIFQSPTIYVTDIISNEQGNKFVKPHIDTPYRFDRWHNETALLGIQCIVPLETFTKENGGTGIYPGSHLRDWVVKDSYRGLYNEEFVANCIQPEMSPGDVLIYNPRLLHSTMPNSTSKVRRALLSHITNSDMIPLLKQVDNIWLELENKH